MAAGDYDVATRLLERGLELRRALGATSASSQTRFWRSSGWIFSAATTNARARCSRRAASSLARAVKDTWGISVALLNLGRVRLCVGDAASARGELEHGLRVARERGDRRVEAELVQGLAAVLALEERPVEAVRLLGAADALRESTGAAASPAETMLTARFLSPLRESMGESAFEAELAVGRATGVVRTG